MLSEGGVIHDVVDRNETQFCPYLMGATYKDQALDLISQPLSHPNIIKFGPSFGEIANDFLDQLLGEQGMAVISSQTLNLFTVALVEGPLFNMHPLPHRLTNRKVNFEQLGNLPEREILTHLNGIQLRCQSPFQIRSYKRLREKGTMKSRNYLDTILLRQIHHLSNKIYPHEECDDESGNVTCEGNDIETQSISDIPMVHTSLLSEILQKNKRSTHSLGTEVIADLARLLWISMDVGSAWIQMAILLLKRDKDACTKIRNEIDSVASRVGFDSLFEKFNLSCMIQLDALVFEAIRLCAPFCGGLWKVNKTVDLVNDEVQIPASSHVIINASEYAFNLKDSTGKLPQNLGDSYPNKYLHGYLPLFGHEVPLMVLQAKVLLVVLLAKSDITGLGPDGTTMHSGNFKWIPIQPRRPSSDGCISVSSDEIVKGKYSPKSMPPSHHECRSWFESKPFPFSKNDVKIVKRSFSGRNN